MKSDTNPKLPFDEIMRRALMVKPDKEKKLSRPTVKPPAAKRKKP